MKDFLVWFGITMLGLVVAFMVIAARVEVNAPEGSIPSVMPGPVATR